MTGRMVSGEEAVRIGLATRTAADLRAEAVALAREIASKSPEAVRGAKQLFNHAPTATVADQLALERATIAPLIGSPNQREAIRAYFEKRSPSFTD